MKDNAKVTLTFKQLKRLVKESKPWPKDIEYDDEEIDMVDEPKNPNKDEEQKSPTIDRAKEIRAEIREIKKERAGWIQQAREEYERYQRFEDRAGWVTRAKANKIRDGFAERQARLRSYIGDCNARLKALNKKLKDLVKETPVKEEFGDDETIPNDQVNEFEEHLRTAQKEVEAAARIVCNSHNPAAIQAWRNLNNMSEDIAGVIHSAYRFRDWGTR